MMSIARAPDPSTSSTMMFERSKGDATRKALVVTSARPSTGRAEVRQRNPNETNVLEQDATDIARDIIQQARLIPFCCRACALMLFL